MANGAEILATADEVWAKGDMIMKVKEPVAEEYARCRPNQLVFTYFHFASSEERLTHAMLKSGAVCLAYETVETKDRQLPLLIPMSEVAGRMAIQQGAKYLEKPVKGRGVLLGGVPGVRPVACWCWAAVLWAPRPPKWLRAWVLWSRFSM